MVGTYVILQKITITIYAAGVVRKTDLPTSQKKSAIKTKV